MTQTFLSVRPQPRKAGAFSCTPTRSVAMTLITKSSRRARFDRLEKFCKPRAVGAFPSPRNLSAGTFESRAMNSATLACLGPKTTISAATRIANCARIKALSAATRTRRAVKTVNSCKRASSVVKRLMRHASRRQDAPVATLTVPNHRQ